MFPTKFVELEQANDAAQFTISMVRTKAFLRRFWRIQRRIQMRQAFFKMKQSNMSGSSSQLSIGPKIYPSFRLIMAFDIFNDTVTKAKISSLLLDWLCRLAIQPDFNLRNEEEYVPIRPTKKKNERKCGYCRAPGHYAPTCPQKLAEADRDKICYRVCLENGHPAAHLVEIA